MSDISEVCNAAGQRSVSPTSQKLGFPVSSKDQQ